MSAAERLYRAVLRAYPRRFRQTVGPELLAAFSRGLGERRRGFAFRELTDLLCNLPAEWLTRASGAEPDHGQGGERASQLFQYLVADARIAVRGFRRRPGFALAIVAVLGLGIGATTAIFTVAHGVLQRPLPYGYPDRLVNVWQTAPRWRDSPNPLLRSMADEFPISWATYRDWLELNTSFDAIGIYTGSGRYTMTGGEAPEVVRAAQTSSGVFAALGVPPFLGRTLIPDDDRVGAPPLVVLSHGLWASRFGADSSVVGRTVVLNEVNHTIVGVMPRSFYFPSPSTGLWRSIEEGQKVPRGNGQSFTGIARLKPALSIDQAQREMEGVTERIREAVPEHQYGVRLMDRREAIVGDVRPVLGLLLAAVATVLLITCANIANLLLMRSSERRQELAIRTALGAGRARILTQLLTESMLLALVGGAIGLALAVVGLEPLVALLPPELPRANEIRLDKTVLLVISLVSIGTGLVIGMLPAVSAVRSRPTGALPSSDSRTIGGRSRSRTQNTIVVAEIALSFVLLVGAGLLTKSMVEMSSVDLGFDEANLVTLRFNFLGERYESTEQRSALYDQLRERLLVLPGVSRASASDWVPFVGSPSGGSLHYLDATGPQRVNVGWNAVSEDYFDVLGIPIVSGRGFDLDDMSEEPQTAIISETMARTYWPGEDPVGERIGRNEGRELVIVGVARDIKHPGGGLDQTNEPRALVYTPGRIRRIFALRVVGEPSVAITAAQAAVQELDPDLQVVVSVVEEEVRASLAGPRFRSWVVGLLASLAALLASVGIYGVLSYAVTQRTREIGVRMALGATTRNVLDDVVRRGLFLIGTGMVTGLALVLVIVNAAPTFGDFLFEVSPTDPFSIVGVTLLLGMAGLWATVLPAVRATSVDPSSTLRRE
jgi:putative ABC transport system permease protein